MKTPEQRGPTGAWAYEARDAASLSPEQVVERLALAGIEVRAATIRGIEAGSKTPGRGLLKALAGVYGSRPPTIGEAEAPDLAAAINALVAECRAWRQEDRDRLAAVERSVERLLAASPSAPKAEGSPARPVPRTTAG